jgi:hypothetical protein
MYAPRPSTPFLVRVGLAVLTVGVVAGCSSGRPAASGSPSARPSVSTSAPAATSPASGAAQASCDSDPWGSVPVSVSHNVPVPPVPEVTGIQAAAHADCGYDRLVLSLHGKMPSYTIRYVSHVVADPSGQTLSLPGARYLLITLRPTDAHQGSGAPTVASGVVAPGFPALLGYTVAGDFEGVVTVAVGLRAETGIRVGELPGRLYVDFQH